MTAPQPGPISHLRIEQALDAISDCFLLLDPEFAVAYVNPAAERTLQACTSDLLGHIFWERWPATIGSEIDRRFRKALKTDRAQHFEHHFVDTHLHLWLDIHAYPSAEGLAIFFRDITAESQEQARLARIERAYKAALSNTPDLVYVFDRNHRFTYANKALLTMWGRTWDDAIGKNCLELGYPGWHAAMHDREIEQVIATKKLIRGEVPFTGTQGRRIYEYIFVPVLDTRGVVEAVAGTTRDITQRQQAEHALRQAEKLAVAGRLATSISHEINNPLEAITNLLYLIHRDPALSPETRTFLETAQSELARVSHIATQTLRFYRQNTRPTATPIPEILDSVAALYERRLRNADITIERRYSQNQPVLVFSGEIRQIVANLVGNALDAIGTDGRIILRDRHITDPLTGLPATVISVADSGSGIPPDILPHIFEPFFTTKSLTGTGLGLWVCKEIIEKHGGRIRVRSCQHPPRQGTVFSILLPGLEPGANLDSAVST